MCALDSGMQANLCVRTDRVFIYHRGSSVVWLRFVVLFSLGQFVPSRYICTKNPPSSVAVQIESADTATCLGQCQAYNQHLTNTRVMIITLFFTQC